MSRRPTAADLRRLFDGLSANDRTRFVQSEAFQADARAIYLDQLEQALLEWFGSQFDTRKDHHWPMVGPTGPLGLLPELLGVVVDKVIAQPVAVEDC